MATCLGGRAGLVDWIEMNREVRRLQQEVTTVMASTRVPFEWAFGQGEVFVR